MATSKCNSISLAAAANRRCQWMQEGKKAKCWLLEKIKGAHNCLSKQGWAFDKSAHPGLSDILKNTAAAQVGGGVVSHQVGWAGEWWEGKMMGEMPPVSLMVIIPQKGQLPISLKCTAHFKWKECVRDS